jgi:hypothetical protein
MLVPPTDSSESFELHVSIWGGMDVLVAHLEGVKC